MKECDLILDVGCGEGRFISQDPSRIVGIEQNDKSIQRCKQRDFDVTSGDARSLPYEEKSVPAIHCSHLIEHFAPVDVHKILSEFNRVLAPDGILVIRSPLLWDGFYSDLTHIRPYNPDVIIHYLTPLVQCTLEHISDDFKVIYLKWRYAPLRVGSIYLSNRWGFPWLKKNGYMLVMRKSS